MRRGLVIAGIVIFALLTACQPEPPQITSADIIQKLNGFVPNYFPMVPGSWWEYTITHPGKDALSYEEIFWPTNTNGSGLLQAARGLENLQSNVSDPRIILKVSQKVLLPAPYESQTGYALEYNRNDLELYQTFRGIYFVPINDAKNGFSVNVLRVYSPSSGAAPSRAITDGYSIQKLFFGSGEMLFAAMDLQYANKGLIIASWSNSYIDPKTNKEIPAVETLQFLGTDSEVAGYAGKVTLHFRRVVTAGSTAGTDPKLNQAFTEDTWYAENVGLVRLEQKINGTVVMTWVLAGYHAS